MDALLFLHGLSVDNPKYEFGFALLRLAPKATTKRKDWRHGVKDFVRWRRTGFELALDLRQLIFLLSFLFVEASSPGFDVDENPK